MYIWILQLAADMYKGATEVFKTHIGAVNNCKISHAISMATKSHKKFRIG